MEAKPSSCSHRSRRARHRRSHGLWTIGTRQRVPRRWRLGDSTADQATVTSFDADPPWEGAADREQRSPEPPVARASAAVRRHVSITRTAPERASRTRGATLSNRFDVRPDRCRRCQDDGRAASAGDAARPPMRAGVGRKGFTPSGVGFGRPRPETPAGLGCHALVGSRFRLWRAAGRTAPGTAGRTAGRTAGSFSWRGDRLPSP